MKRYASLYADPPWAYDDKLPGPSRGAEKNYTVLDDDALLALPMVNRAADDCALFLWATGPRLPLAIACTRAWGFEFITVAFVWIKLTQAGEALDEIGVLARADEPIPERILRMAGAAHPEAFGMGRWTRSAVEYVLLARRGRPSRISAGVRQVVYWRAPSDAPHSAKPPEVRDRIVELMGDVPRLELFARERAPGWDATGLELDGLDIMEVLCPESTCRLAVGA